MTNELKEEKKQLKSFLFNRAATAKLWEQTSQIIQKENVLSQ